MLTNTKLIIFDLDGVLVDSKQAILNGFHQAFHYFGYDFHDQKIVDQFGIKAVKVIENLVPAKQANRKKVVNQICNYYFKIHADQGKQAKIKLKPRVKSTIKKLYNQGYKLAIISNSTKRAVRNSLEPNQILIYFDQVIGADDDFKDKVQAAKYLLKHYQIKPSQAVYVGDMVRDVAVARKIGCLVIAIPDWDSKRKFKAVKPDFLLTDISELT